VGQSTSTANGLSGSLWAFFIKILVITDIVDLEQLAVPDPANFTYPVLYGTRQLDKNAANRL
jgi:hypothetical protein